MKLPIGGKEPWSRFRGVGFWGEFVDNGICLAVAGGTVLDIGNLWDAGCREVSFEEALLVPAALDISSLTKGGLRPSVL